MGCLSDLSWFGCVAVLVDWVWGVCLSVLVGWVWGVYLPLAGKLLDSVCVSVTLLWFFHVVSFVCWSFLSPLSLMSVVLIYCALFFSLLGLSVFFFLSAFSVFFSGLCSMCLFALSVFSDSLSWVSVYVCLPSCPFYLYFLFLFCIAPCLFFLS